MPCRRPGGSRWTQRITTWQVQFRSPVTGRIHTQPSMKQTASCGRFKRLVPARLDPADGSRCDHGWTNGKSTGRLFCANRASDAVVEYHPMAALVVSALPADQITPRTPPQRRWLARPNAGQSGAMVNPFEQMQSGAIKNSLWTLLRELHRVAPASGHHLRTAN